MATISSANLTTLVDNIAKVVTDMTSSFVTNPTNSAPTVATITSGMNGSSTSTQAHLAALSDFSEELALVTGANTSIANAIALMTSYTSPNTLYLQFVDLMNSIDNHVSGLNAFLVANSLQVHPNFSATFNYFALNATALGKRGPANAPTSIAAANIFPAAAVTPMSTISVTGASAGTVAAGSTISTASYGAVPLYLENTSAGAAAAATNFTVTYTTASGTSSTIGKTIAAAMGTGTSNAVALGVSGTAVTNIVVNSSGTSGESYVVYAPILRAIAY